MLEGMQFKRQPSLVLQTSATSIEIRMKNPQKLNISAPYDPAMPFPGICPKELTSYSTNTCSAMFIAPLFTRARKWKQPKYSSI